MKIYKLTEEYGRTMGGTQWGPGITHTATGEAAKSNINLVKLAQQAMAVMP